MCDKCNIVMDMTLEAFRNYTEIFNLIMIGISGIDDKDERIKEIKRLIAADKRNELFKELIEIAKGDKCCEK